MAEAESGPVSRNKFQFIQPPMHNISSPVYSDRHCWNFKDLTSVKTPACTLADSEVLNGHSIYNLAGRRYRKCGMKEETGEV